MSMSSARASLRGRWSIVLLAASLTAPVSASAAADGPAPIDIAPGAAYGINDHGQVVGGQQYNPGWVWKQGVGMTVLGAAPGSRSGVPRAINENGMVVGTIPVGGNGSQGFVWTPASGSVVLGNLDGDAYWSTDALDVNERSQIAGMRGNGRFTMREDQAVMWTPEGWMTALARQNSMGAAINDRGQVAGTIDQLCSWLCGGHAVLWTQAGEAIMLGDLPGADYSRATDINNSGQVVGYSGGSASSHAFLWTQTGGMVDLGALPGADSSAARGINDSGQVVGDSGGRAFLWTQAGGMVELGGLPGTFSAAYAINTQGQVAGTSGDRAVLWFGDTTRPTARLQIRRGEKLADVRSRGLRLQLTVSEPGSTEIMLTRSRKTLANRTVSVTTAGTSAVTIKLDRTIRVALRKSSKATFTLRAATRDAAGNSSVTTTKLTVKR